MKPHYAETTTTITAIETMPGHSRILQRHQFLNKDQWIWLLFLFKENPVQTVIISDGMREIHLTLFNKSRQVLLSNEPVDISEMTEGVGKKAGSFHEYT